VRLSVGDGAHSSSRLLALDVENVLPTNLRLLTSASQVRIGEPLMVSGSFFDPGNDSWQATLFVRDSSTQQSLLHLPLVLSRQAFATSLVFDRPARYTVTVIITDDDGTSSTDALLVTVTDVLAPGDANRDGRFDSSDLVTRVPSW
jgi:hypothetical protein